MSANGTRRLPSWKGRRLKSVSNEVSLDNPFGDALEGLVRGIRYAVECATIDGI